MRYLVCLLFLSNIGGAFVSAQIPYDQTDFRSPLDIPLVLAGTFGELRSNHFHAGIDIKTKGRVGFPVIAIEDGYVSRVKTRPGGYGKALYFTHYNGYTSVYAHLQRFDKDVADYLLGKQYEKQQFSIDLFPDKGQFTFQKGDTIAWTGNSGSSTAPHLHFEIRDTKSQQTINPLLFGFKAKDTTPPIIKNVHIYPLNESASVNGSTDTLRISVQQVTPGKYKFEFPKPIVNGTIGFGIDVFDRLDNAPNKNGVYSIELFIDSSLVYKHKMERFAFSETRYINSLMDYHAKKNYSLRPQKSFKDPNNKLSVYEYLEKDGRLNFETNGTHIAEYRIRDKAGNSSEITFEFSSDSSLTLDTEIKNENLFLYSVDNKFVEADIELYIKENSLYDNIDFSYSAHNAEGGFIADIHCVHSEETPLHSAFNIALAIDSLEESLRSKALICTVNKKGEISCLNTQWHNDTLTAKSKIFGDFSAVIDTISPTLKTKSFSTDLSNAKFMSFTVEDTLSGIGSYNAFVDGEWILLEYDPKNKALIHFFDGRVKPGQHELEIIVEDSVKNEKRLQLQFLR